MTFDVRLRIPYELFHQWCDEDTFSESLVREWLSETDISEIVYNDKIEVKVIRL